MKLLSSKPFFLFIIVYFILNTDIQSQVLISSITGSPDNSAMLEIQSNSKGLLIPRLTSAERTGIPSPSEGLLVYDSDEQSFFIFGKRADKTIGWYNISDHSSIWSKTGSMVYLSQSTDNVGIGTSTPNKKLVIQAENSTDTLMEILDPSGLPLMIITPKLTKFNFIESGKAVSSGFSVGRYSAYKGGKATEDTTLFLVTPDSTRVYSLETSSVSGGFSVLRYDSYKKGPAESFMFMVPENYLLGHKSGKLLQSGIYSGKFNTFLGYQTGMSDTLGSRNVFLGYEAGYNNTTGSDNVFLGYQSGYNNTIAGDNISIGSGAGFSNQVNGDNIFIGLNAGYFHGSDGPEAGNYKNNIYIGMEAGFGVVGTSFGKNNVYIGPYSGRNSTTGQLNVFIGYRSGQSIESGYENVIIGNEAGHAITSGYSNTFLGTFTGQGNSIGSNNTYIGDNAGRDLTNGVRNTFIGSQAGQLSIAGNYNVFLGFNAGRSHNSGDNNVYIGYLAGQGNLNPENGVNNVFIGTESGTSNELGSENVFLGYHTGHRNLSGTNNTYLGTESGREMTTGSHNTFMGSYAGSDAVDGNQNIFLGYLTGQFHTAGDDNVFLGNAAGRGETTLTGTNERNVILGAGSGTYINNAIDNVFIGHLAAEGILANTVSGDYNVVIGESAGRNLSSGSSNIIIGNMAGFNNTTGNNNVFMGPQSGYDNSTGYSNVFVGYESGSNNTTGYRNTSVGTNAGQNNLTGYENVMLGYNSGLWSRGDRNVFIGNETGLITGSAADLNVFIGYQAGSVANGSRNIFLGSYSGYQIPGAPDVSDQLVIETSPGDNTPLIWGHFTQDLLEFNASVTIFKNSTPSVPQLVITETIADDGCRIRFNNSAETDNTWTINARSDNTDNDSHFRINHNNGTDGEDVLEIQYRNVGVKRTPITNDLEVNGTASKSTAGNWLANSDKRLKKNISTIDTKFALEKILKLRGVTYEWDDNKTDYQRPKGLQYGFIAQEIKEVFPGKVSLDSDGYYQTAYGDYDPLFVQAFKEQQTQIEELAKDNKSMKSEIDVLKKEIQILKEQIKNK